MIFIDVAGFVWWDGWTSLWMGSGTQWWVNGSIWIAENS